MLAPRSYLVAGADMVAQPALVLIACCWHCALCVRVLRCLQLRLASQVDTTGSARALTSSFTAVPPRAYVCSGMAMGTTAFKQDQQQHPHL
eukprot:352115-Chlamydomonas_euryale.AAC.3